MCWRRSAAGVGKGPYYIGPQTTGDTTNTLTLSRTRIHLTSHLIERTARSPDFCTLINWIFQRRLESPFYARDLVAKISSLDTATTTSSSFLVESCCRADRSFLPSQLFRGRVSGLYAGVARLFLVQQITFCINSVCHLLGDRPNNTNDFSTNNALLAIPSLGGAWHNNHHASPSSAYIDFRWWQIDIGGYFIRLLALLGLAWNIKEKPKIQKNA